MYLLGIGSFDGIDENGTASTVQDAINSKYTKPVSGIPASDLASGVIPDVSNKQNIYTIPSFEVTNPIEGDICVVTASEEIIATSSELSIPYDLSSYSDYGIKIVTDVQSASSTGFTITFSDTTTDEITLTNVAQTLTYSAGRVDSVTALSDSALQAGITSISKVITAENKVYHNGS